MNKRSERRVVVIDVPAGLAPAYRRISLEELRQEMLAVSDPGYAVLLAACLDEERLTYSSIAKLDKLVTRFAEVFANKDRQPLERPKSDQYALWYLSDASFNLRCVSMLDVAGLIESRMADLEIPVGPHSGIVTLRPPNALVSITRKRSFP